MTRPADPSLYLDNYSEDYPSAGDLRGELDTWDALSDEALEAEDELDITPMAEGRFVVEARITCDAPWAAVLATYLGNLGMTVEVRPAEIEGVEEKAG